MKPSINLLCASQQMQIKPKSRNRQKKLKAAFEVARAKIAKHGLPMKLVDVEYTFDGSKLIFSSPQTEG